jgi:hypothetical protein
MGDWMADSDAVDLVVELSEERDIIVARQRAREFARDLGFGMLD